ncbi:hypothetical protein MNBD_GAMMA22-2864 [hydrothermal vent metagenome]|uniref:STAS domain-containing protein n=1 Tax=hydrothermal vent metagenome TaxID=652676 RepID=A0A3B1B3H8_9ZZZZ
MALSVTEKNGNVHIQLEQKFTFECHREMRASYEGRASGTNYTLDFSRTEYIDSSALGMLLLLREAAGGDSHKIDFINCKPAVRKVFDVANFSLMFNIK